MLWPLGLSTALSLMGDATLYIVLPTQTAAAGLAYDRSSRRRLYIPARGS